MGMVSTLCAGVFFCSIARLNDSPLFSFKIESHRCYDVWPSVCRFHFALLFMLMILTIEHWIYSQPPCQWGQTFCRTHFIFILSFVCCIQIRQWCYGWSFSCGHLFLRTKYAIFNELSSAYRTMTTVLYRANSILYIYVNMLFYCSFRKFHGRHSFIRKWVSEWMSEQTRMVERILAFSLN